ncbi:MAG: M20/M25/M40 family metallo-hydrolase [Clostridia bacterium]|nr:M20/M25/M40 family metallo-hydrolase [Clostridia bacterium]
MQEKVFAYLEANQERAIDLLKELISFESVATPTDDPAAPQGQAVLDCLLCAKRAAEGLGLSTMNLDGHALLIDDTAENDAKIGMLCHLDIVPAGEGWTHKPFAAEIEDGKLYGRGATDDKGPFVSALFALAALKNCGADLKHHVRLIAGTCEETGSADIAYCKEKGVIPPHVFSPDASFPVVNTEKGIARFSLSATLPAGTRLATVRGGEVINMVPQNAHATLSDSTTVTEIGKAAHASTPHLGENAISRLLDTLCERLMDDAAYPVLLAARDLHPLHETDGASLNLKDEEPIAGPLTANLGLIDLTDGVLTLSFDVRYPLNVNEEILRERLAKRLKDTPFALADMNVMPPHHVPEESALVQSLLAAYESVSGKKGYCMSMGGGTYVHDIDGGVAFGTVYPDEDCCIHSPDEFIPVGDLVQNAKIFAASLLRLQEQDL